ncbi:BON domain-containing protein [Dyella acidiphila]|uniref:BON domain-containing protein n=1 Tax=Dyella acidiphila TaxID=2775866 RepID=A0ABR9GC12_9GAMM|nr:BON domain-containing protein [Dyella acidiphila]MBE1161572.1 BON domain-containing protein [Dyella acidiphila]
MRHPPNHAALASVCFVALLTSAALFAQPQTAPASSSSSTSSPAVDNTQTNTRDRSGQTTTPTHQPNDKTDIKLAAAVRRAIVKDKSLSTLAHNVKIVAADGTVTLRGPVKSEDEKSRVETAVKDVSGVNSVDNELDVKQ